MVKSVFSALRVLEEVASRQVSGVTEISRALQMPKSSVHRLLATLSDAGWVRASGADVPRYVLTSKALVIGRMVSPELGLREAARPEMVRLRDATQETVHLSVREGDEVVIVERIDSEQPVRVYSALGSHGAMHTTASGKAVLAALPEDEVDRFMRAGLHPRTVNTITDVERLHAELVAVRRNGYAVNRGENRLEVAAVAAVIRDDDGRPIGALNVTAPASRTSDADLQRFGTCVIETCTRLENQMGLRH